MLSRISVTAFEDVTHYFPDIFLLLSGTLLHCLNSLLRRKFCEQLSALLTCPRYGNGVQKNSTDYTWPAKTAQ